MLNQVRIFDNLGKQVILENTNQHVVELNTARLSEGHYSYVVLIDNQLVSGHFFHYSLIIFKTENVKTKFSFTIFCIGILSMTAFGQAADPSQKILPPSPAAAALTKQIDFPVNTSSGIPLFFTLHLCSKDP